MRFATRKCQNAIFPCQNHAFRHPLSADRRTPKTTERISPNQKMCFAIRLASAGQRMSKNTQMHLPESKQCISRPPSRGPEDVEKRQNAFFRIKKVCFAIRLASAGQRMSKNTQMHFPESKQCVSRPAWRRPEDVEKHRKACFRI